MTRMVIYPRHWLCLPAPGCAMHSWSGKSSKMFLRKIPSQSWQWTDLMARTTSTTRATVVRPDPAALQHATSCYFRLALQTCIYSWWIPWIHYWRAPIRVCIKTLLLQSCARSNRRSTQCLQRSSAQKQRMLIMLLFWTIWPQKWHFRSLKLEPLSHITQ